MIGTVAGSRERQDLGVADADGDAVGDDVVDCCGREAIIGGVDAGGPRDGQADAGFVADGQPLGGQRTGMDNGAVRRGQRCSASGMVGVSVRQNQMSGAVAKAGFRQRPALLARIDGGAGVKEDEAFGRLKPEGIAVADAGQRLAVMRPQNLVPALVDPHDSYRARLSGNVARVAVSIASGAVSSSTLVSRKPEPQARATTVWPVVIAPSCCNCRSAGSRMALDGSR